MTKYRGCDIERIYTENLSIAIDGLKDIPVARGRKPAFQGLNGWVYEQTIRSCLEDELKQIGLMLEIRDQVTLQGRAKVDLFVGTATAIEIKAGGIFGDDADKYRGYRAIARDTKQWTYLYVTRKETHRPYYEATKQVFGPEAAFFLNEDQGWADFVSAVVQANANDNPAVE